MEQKIEYLELSARSKNCLLQEQIYHISDLVVMNEFDLRCITNMGTKSICEIIKKLDDLGLSLGMDNYHNANSQKPYAKKEPEINIWLDDIFHTQLKKVQLENILLHTMCILSVRSRNVLNIELEHHSNIIEFLKCLFSLNSVLILPNIGQTSALEIQDFLANIRQEIKYLYDSKRKVISTTLDLMEYIGLSKYLIREYKENYQDDQIHFFRIINLMIKNEFNEKEFRILKYRKDYWGKDQIVLEELGKELGITRERIRQIENKVDKRVWSIIKKLSIYVPLINLRQQYKFSDDFISDVAFINQQDNTSFSDNFLYKTLAIFFKNNYQLIIENNNKHKFLINKKLSNVFDFKGFIAKTEDLLDKSYIDYTLNFKGFLYPFFIKPINDEVDVTEIESICENLLYLEFDIVLNIDNQILIKYKKNSIEHYVEEVFKKIKQPMHLDSIYSKIKNNHPEFNKSKRYIGNSFVENNKFIFFDRNSTYGLKSWEGELTQNSKLINVVAPNKTSNNRSGIKVWSENGNIIVKGGTIINIVIEYLGKFETPRHINDIFDEINKWRDTNKHKLLSNLKVNNRNYFIFYGNGYIGLTE